MKNLKQFLGYLIWTTLSLLLGIIYMRIVLGANHISKEGFGYLAHLFYNWGLFYVGLIVGVVVAFLFILLDVFFLKKKLTSNIQYTITRFLFLVFITMLVGLTHYMLEKVIDVI